jgi:hypothetical protein
MIAHLMNVFANKFPIMLSPVNEITGPADIRDIRHVVMRDSVNADDHESQRVRDDAPQRFQRQRPVSRKSYIEGEQCDDDREYAAAEGVAPVPGHGRSPVFFGW